MPFDAAASMMVCAENIALRATQFLLPILPTGSKDKLGRISDAI